MHSVEGPEDDNFLMRGRETSNISDIRNVDDKILMRNSLNLKKKVNKTLESLVAER